MVMDSFAFYQLRDHKSFHCIFVISDNLKVQCMRKGKKRGLNREDLLTE